MVCNYGIPFDIIPPMAAENHTEINQGDPSLEIVLGTPIKPFENEQKYYRRDENFFLVPESYTYTLALRKKVSLHNITGYIDVISEDPIAPVEAYLEQLRLSKRAKPPEGLLVSQPAALPVIEKPFGHVMFEMTVYSPKRKRITESPYILRFSFLPKNPAEYAKLLGSYADVKLGDERYLAAWNLSKPVVRRNMRHLEAGNSLLVIEKNLFNIKGQEGDASDDKEDFERITYVWMPADLDKFQTIEMTFHHFKDWGETDEPLGPSPQEKILLGSR